VNHAAQTGSGPTPRELAEELGLVAIAERPRLRPYLAEVWARRHFIVAFATARNSASYADTRLGQLWQVLTPLLNVAVYFLIFGVLLDTQRGVDNFVGFLVIGIFIFTYTQRSVLAGSRAITNNVGLIRALHFPRACLPLAVTVVELQQLAVSMVVMLGIVVITGETVSLLWLLIAPALVLQTMFNVGTSLIMARLGAKLPDLSQLLPFLMRTWLYLSGVFYSVERFASDAPAVVQELLQANPGAVYIDLVRSALLEEQDPSLQLWAFGAGWGVMALLLGFWFFYRGEETYGRG
jgi:teichoic acid transport system permease protein